MLHACVVIVFSIAPNQQKAIQTDSVIVRNRPYMAPFVGGQSQTLSSSRHRGLLLPAHCRFRSGLRREARPRQRGGHTAGRRRQPTKLQQCRAGLPGCHRPAGMPRLADQPAEPAGRASQPSQPSQPRQPAGHLPNPATSASLEAEAWAPAPATSRMTPVSYVPLYDVAGR